MKTKTDWSKIDWSKQSLQISKETGRHIVTVSRARRKHAPETLWKMPANGFGVFSPVRPVRPASAGDAVRIGGESWVVERREGDRMVLVLGKSNAEPSNRGSEEKA